MADIAPMLDDFERRIVDVLTLAIATSLSLAHDPDKLLDSI